MLNHESWISLRPLLNTYSYIYKGSGYSSVSVVTTKICASKQSCFLIQKLLDMILFCWSPELCMGLTHTAGFIGAIRFSAAQLVGCEDNHSSIVLPSWTMSGVKIHFHTRFLVVHWEFILHKFMYPPADNIAEWRIKNIPSILFYY